MEVAPNAPPRTGPQFLVLHLLYMQIPSVEEALQHDTVYKRQGDFLAETGADPKRIPSARLKELVERGELYAWWGQRLDQRADIDPNWHAVDDRRPAAAATTPTDAG